MPTTTDPSLEAVVFGDYPAPHVAAKIEPGAILYSSWGYDQTNIDFYYVTRTTAKSAWIIPLNSVNVDGDPTWAEHVTAGDQPQWFSRWCECRHAIFSHGVVSVVNGDDYPYCRTVGCDCSSPRPKVNTPELHRIQRYGDSESLSLSSYSSARLWGGGKLYASHYA